MADSFAIARLAFRMRIHDARATTTTLQSPAVVVLAHGGQAPSPRPARQRQLSERRSASSPGTADGPPPREHRRHAQPRLPAQRRRHQPRDCRGHGCRHRHFGPGDGAGRRTADPRRRRNNRQSKPGRAARTVGAVGSSSRSLRNGCRFRCARTVAAALPSPLAGWSTLLRRRGAGFLVRLRCHHHQRQARFAHFDVVVRAVIRLHCHTGGRPASRTSARTIGDEGGWQCRRRRPPPSRPPPSRPPPPRPRPRDRQSTPRGPDQGG